MRSFDFGNCTAVSDSTFIAVAFSLFAIQPFLDLSFCVNLRALPPRRRGSQPVTVLPRSQSTMTRWPPR
jgi:hypothetical protein